jgi:dienelactone hydrolase
LLLRRDHGARAGSVWHAAEGVAGFHCGLATQDPGDAARITGKVVVSIGADDPHVDAAQRAAFEDQMRAASVSGG